MRGSTCLKLLACTAPVFLTGCIIVSSPTPNSALPDSPAPAPVADNVVVTPPPPQPVYVEPAPYQPPPPQAAGIYDADLSPYGHWLYYGNYGRCWAPNVVPFGWQPYTVGHWAYADDGSCVWVSEGDECNWGGIVYHYGQWTLTSDAGWIWVPGTVWAPAWVAWREGGGYCGWAPLPPEACQGNVTYVQADHYCPPDRYVYVDERNINVVQVNQQIVHNNVTIINKTTNITNITVVNNHVTNVGVPTDHLRRQTGLEPIKAAVVDAHSPEEARQLARNGTPVRYSSPAIEKVRAITPTPRVTPQPIHQQVQHIDKAVEHSENDLPANDARRLKEPGQPMQIPNRDRERPVVPPKPDETPKRVEKPVERNGNDKLPPNSPKREKEPKGDEPTPGQHNGQSDQTPAKQQHPGGGPKPPAGQGGQGPGKQGQQNGE